MFAITKPTRDPMFDLLYQLVDPQLRGRGDLSTSSPT